MDVQEIIILLEKLYLNSGYLLIFFATLIESTPFGFAIPGGLIVALGGFYSFNGPLTLIGVIVSGWLGMLSTFLIAYLLGKSTGMSLAKKLHQEKNAAKANTLLKNHGPAILTTSLLANLLRFWVAYVAGSHKYPFLKFLFFINIASLTWVSLLTVVGYIAGSGRGEIETGLARLGILAWGLLALSLFIIYKTSKVEFEKFQEDKL